MKKELKHLLIVLGISLVFLPVNVYADMINYHFSTEPSIKKNIKWSISGHADEYRILSGAGDESEYENARYVGSGSSATVEVDKNEIYTLYAKSGEEIYFVQVPVTNIDHTPPEIRIMDIVSSSEKRVTVFYDIDDYYGVKEVRLRSGSHGIEGFSGGKTVSGGVIPDLEDGTYTLFAKDKAGNISVYTMAVSSDYKETQSSEVFSTEYHEYESTEWATTDLWVTPETTIAETTVPETSIPQTTVPQTTAPQTTVPQTTVPQTTAHQTTVPQTTAPQTTVPQTTVPETTVPQTTVPETSPVETTRSTIEPPETRPKRPSAEDKTYVPEESSPEKETAATKKDEILVVYETTTIVPTNPKDSKPTISIKTYPQTGSMSNVRTLKSILMMISTLTGSMLIGGSAFYKKRKAEDQGDEQEK